MAIIATTSILHGATDGSTLSFAEGDEVTGLDEATLQDLFDSGAIVDDENEDPEDEDEDEDGIE